MARFNYFQAEQIAPQQQATEAARPAAPINALQFFDDETAEQKAWTGVVDNVMEAGSVATDIYAKLGEAEHQNQADKFTLEYNQRIMKLRDDINTKNVTSKTHDLNDLKGLTAFYQEEESKIFNDLSKTYNPQNYKRRDSLMKNRKSGSFLNAMSSIRQQRIRDITKEAQQSHDLQVQGAVKSVTNKSFDKLVEMYEAGKEGDQKRFQTIKEDYNDQIKEVTTKLFGDATKKYHAGIITKPELDDLPNKVNAEVQTQVAMMLYEKDPEMFLKYADNFPEDFALADSYKMARMRAGSLKVVEKDASQRQQGLAYTDIANSYHNIEKLSEIEKNLAKKSFYKDWNDTEARSKLRITLQKRITQLKTASDKPDATRSSLRDDLENAFASAKQGDPQIDLPGMPSSQTIKRVFKDPEEAASFEAQVQMANETLPIVKSLRRGEISYGEAKEQFYALSPRQDSDSPLFNDKMRVWNRAYKQISDYNSSKQKNKAVHTLEEMDANIVGTEARLSSVQLQGPNRIEEGKFHLRSVLGDADKLVNRQLVYNGKNKQLKTFKNDTNQQLLSKVQIMTPGALSVMRQIPIEQRDDVVKEVYGPYAALAYKDMKEAGVYQTWHGIFPSLTARAQSIFRETLNNPQATKFEPGRYENENSSQAFMEKIGKGIETEAVRADLRNIYFKHIGLARVNGDDRSYSELADELFEGIQLVELPNHPDSHLQNSTWMSAQELSDMDIDEDVAAEGFTSILLGFTDNLNEDPIYFMGLDKLDPAHLVKLPPSAVQKYPKLRETIEKTYNEMISANIKIGSNGERPIFTMVRSPDGENWNLAMKQNPRGGIVRLGTKEDGVLKPISFSKEDILEHANRYNQKKQSYKLLIGESFLGITTPNLMDDIPDDQNIYEILETVKSKVDKGSDAVAMEQLMENTRKILIKENVPESLSGDEAKAKIKQILENDIEYEPRSYGWWDALKDLF